MKVVSNTTPVISLASAGQIFLLNNMFGEIIIPEAVYHEIKAKKSYGYHEVEADFIKVQSIRNTHYKEVLLNHLDAGEAETIILASEVNADIVIIDDTIGYQTAKNEGLHVIRTLSILLLAKKKGMIPEIKTILDDLILKGRWYSKKTYEMVLSRAGEC